VRRQTSPASQPPRPANDPPTQLAHGLDSARILRILPQRPPLLLIDRVVELHTKKYARAVKCVSANEPLCQGHMPNAPVFPALLCIEAMSQLLCVLLYVSRALDPRAQRYAFAGIEKAKFRQPVVPGDRMDVTVKVIQQRSNIWKCAGSVSVDDVLCVEAELLAAVQDCEDEP
jgi:3-hydroxyacyl-[acyl-carrier-protein] dehydratase